MKNKKIIIFFSVVFILPMAAIFFLISRGGVYEDYVPYMVEQAEIYRDYLTEDIGSADLVYTEPLVDDVPYDNVIETVDFTLEELLEDFDYLIKMMESTMPFFGVSERRFGVNIHEVAARARNFFVNFPYYPSATLIEEFGIELSDFYPLDEQIFWLFVGLEFFDQIPRAFHLHLFDAIHFDFFTRFNSTASVFHINGYQHRETGIPRLTFSSVGAPLGSILHTSPVTRTFYENNMNFLFDIFSMFLTDDMDMDMDMYNIENMFFGGYASARIRSGDPEIVTEIIEENRVAYVSIPSFYLSAREIIQANRILTEFYREIQDFEHLIIDIRGNGGGNAFLPHQFIIHPLWSGNENVADMEFYTFFAKSEFGRSVAEIHVGGGRVRGVANIGGYFSVGENELFAVADMPDSHLPYLNEDDRMNLGYGIRMSTNPLNFGRPDIPHTPFYGQIWLLIDGGNHSATALFARQAKHMNFAIFVGEQIGGSYTFSYILLTLPNTGILVKWDIPYFTDLSGRSWEEFPTTPHYFNREGYDALETVLQMIGEL